QVADIEEAVALRNQAVVAASRSPAPTLPAALPAGYPFLPWGLEADTDGPDPALWTLGSRHETPGLAERVDPSSTLPLTIGSARGGNDGGGGGGGGGVVGSAGAQGTRRGGRGGTAELCRSPPRVRLRTRIGKRCRKDLAAGRTGILIKATFNPLEGDSSTANKGVKKKWFKKDCSAALLVPRITVAALPSSLALLGPSATAEQKDAREGERKEAGDASGTPSSPGEGAGADPSAVQQRCQPQPSLILRVVNPQQDTVVRVRVAAEDAAVVPANMGVGGGGGGSGGNDVGGRTPSLGLQGAGKTGQEVPRVDEGAGSTAVTLEGSPARGAPATVAGSAAAAATQTVVSVRAEGWEEGDWIRLEGKEDEVLRQPGDRHGLPDGALLSSLGGEDDGDSGSPTKGGEGRSTRSSGTTPFLLHQQGDVAWVRIPIDEASGRRVAAIASSSARALVVVDVRFSFVMGE
ncbi:unnamed protein product, partial [Hapterophycus canaliculatus]